MTIPAPTTDAEEEEGAWCSADDCRHRRPSHYLGRHLRRPDCPNPTGANDEEAGQPVVQREDRYTITVDGFRVTATDDQEARIRAMTAEQAARFVRVMGRPR